MKYPTFFTVFGDRIPPVLLTLVSAIELGFDWVVNNTEIFMLDSLTLFM
jgi:hypothetical protein